MSPVTFCHLINEGGDCLGPQSASAQLLSNPVVPTSVASMKRTCILHHRMAGVVP